MLRILVTVLLLAVLIFIIYLVLRRFMPELIPLLRSGTAEQIEDYISSFGSFKGVVVTFLLQAIQVVSIVFPAMAIQVASGIIFGWVEATLICYASFCLTNVGVFLMARRLRRSGNALTEVVDDERSRKRFKFITESDHPEYMVMLAYMMPFLPNGFIPYVAARTRVSLRRFTVAMAVGSFPTIVVFCAIGGRILAGDFIFAGVLFVVAFAFILVMYLLRGKIMSAAEYISARIRMFLMRLKHRAKNLAKKS